LHGSLYHWEIDSLIRYQYQTYQSCPEGAHAKSLICQVDANLLKATKLCGENIKWSDSFDLQPPIGFRIG
jgi:transcription elongation factor Elf1